MMIVISLAVVAVTHLSSKFHLVYNLQICLEYFFQTVPDIHLENLDPAILNDDGVKSKQNTKPQRINCKRGTIECFDPATFQKLGEVPALGEKEVRQACAKAKAAQEIWKTTSFAQRRQVLRTLQKYICAHVQEICRVSARDSGKPAVDAVLGEILTTTEKIRTIVVSGELWLRPEQRDISPMFMHKTAYLEYVPLGVIGTIAPW